MTGHFNDTGFVPLNIAVLTVSDTRTEEDDKSGRALKERALEAGHRVVEKAIVPDDVYQMRAVVSGWIADPEVQVVLVTGGTGFTERDSTPEALTPLFDDRNQLLYYLGVQYDVTLQVEAEQEVARLKERLAELAASSGR